MQFAECLAGEFAECLLAGWVVSALVRVAVSAAPLNVARSCSSGFAMTASSRGPNSRCSAVKLAVRASRAAATASSGVAGPGAAAAPSASSREWVSWPANRTSRLSGKCRKKVALVSPARSAIWVTVVLS